MYQLEKTHYEHSHDRLSILKCFLNSEMSNMEKSVLESIK